MNYATLSIVCHFGNPCFEPKHRHWSGHLSSNYVVVDLMEVTSNNNIAIILPVAQPISRSTLRLHTFQIQTKTLAKRAFATAAHTRGATGRSAKTWRWGRRTASAKAPTKGLYKNLHRYMIASTAYIAVPMNSLTAILWERLDKIYYRAFGYIQR